MDGSPEEKQIGGMTVGKPGVWGGVTERGCLLGNPIESHKGHWAQDTEVNDLKTKLSMSESAAEFELLSALTFPSALASARREACPLLVLPRSWEHIQSRGDAAGEIRRAVSIEKWGREPDCRRIKEGVGGEEVAAVTSE